MNETEIDVSADSKPTISNSESTSEDTKEDVSIDMNVSEDLGGDGIAQGEDAEFRDDFVDWENMTDSDDDGLPDSYETDIGTDIYNADTDGDGLTDGFEELWSATNPLKIGSFNDGISDSELDLDSDDLGMLEEYNYGTDPLEADSDNDGLNDGTEVHIKGTDPLVEDTDGDGLVDGDEVIVGLDPLKTSTYESSDMEYCYQVDIDQDEKLLKRINDNNEEYKMSLQINAKGPVLSNIYIRESAYVESISGDHILGVIPEIICSYKQNISDMIIYFEINEKLLDEDNSIVSFEGVNRYNIFKYDEDENGLFPINTSVDETNNIIFANIDEIGTYCIVDMEKWLKGLGFNLTDYGAWNYSSEEMVMLNYSIENIDDSSLLTLNDDSSITKKNIDIVFQYNNYLDNLTDEQFLNIKDNILMIGKYLYSESESVHIYIIDQCGNKISLSEEQDYASDIYELEKMIQKMTNTHNTICNLMVLVQSLFKEIDLRDDSNKIVVFIGTTYCSEQEKVLKNIKDSQMQCIIICPKHRVDSFYERLATETGGLLLSNYFFFFRGVIEHIYGYMPFMSYVPYTVVSSTGLRNIALEDEIRKDSKTNSDTDDLTDWDEIAKNKVIVNEDGSVTLQNYWEYLYKNFGKRTIYLGWNGRFRNLYNKDGKTLEEMLSEIYVLPIISDPTKEDSDGDGIKDDEEVVWDGVDERYHNVDPLHKDTIETLFPELTENGYNNRANATYISVDGNDVVLHVKAYFTGDAEAKVSQYLKTTGLSQECQDEVDNIKSRLGEDFTFKELIIDGVQSRWSGVYRGSSYDFCPGLKVNFTIDFVEDDNPEIGERSIEVSVKNGVCGYSNCVNRFGWKTNSIRIIQVYTSYCENSSHKNRIFKDCYDYAINQYDIAQYGGAIAHEFGHAFGLADMYDEADYNKGYEPVSNDELKYDKIYSFIPSGKGIMMISGKAVTNDIEMILIAFCENKKQFYVPQGTSQKVSKAIKSEVSYVHNLNSGNIYQWNQTTHSFQIR